MSLKIVEIVVLGQVLRLNVPQEQEDALRQAARNLDALVSEMKEKTGLIQLDRVLSIVALNLSFELTQEKNKNTQIEEVLKKYNLDTALDKKVYDMSVGEKQTLEIVKVLCRGANILILDEPFSSIDKESQELMTDYIVSLKKNKMIVFVTHIKEFENKM